MTVEASTGDDTDGGSAGPASVHRLSAATDGTPLPNALDRLRGRPDEDRLRGWLVTLAVTALAAVLRFWHLAQPRDVMFDETYYAKDAWSLWERGYAVRWVDGADEALLSGRSPAGLMTDDPTMVVHPELGKWLIGLGERLVGMEPLGWRLAPAIAGTLLVLVMVRLVRRLTGSTLLGGLAGVLLCLDGLALTMSRIALLDIFVACFLLSAVACLVADRDQGRRRMAELVGRSGLPDPGGWGPVRGLRLRPWRLAAGLFFGLAIASKWSAVVPLAGFGLLVVAWDAGARRMLGVRHAWLKAALADGVPAFASLVLVALAVYVVSWTGWLVHADVLEARFARNNYGPYWGSYVERDPDGLVSSTTQALRSLWHYHRDVWAFHTGGLDQATHSYQSAPQSWLLMRRPVVVSVELDIPPGTQGCAAPAGSTCLREVILLGTPMVWWSGVLAWGYAVYAWLARRDWRFGLALVGLLTTWVPFFLNADRPIFSFYAVTVLPFTVLALTLLLGRVLGPADAGPRRRTAGAVVVGSVVALTVVNLAWLWPILTGELVTYQEWLRRMWFRSWI